MTRHYRWHHRYCFVPDRVGAVPEEITSRQLRKIGDRGAGWLLKLTETGVPVRIENVGTPVNVTGAAAYEAFLRGYKPAAPVRYQAQRSPWSDTRCRLLSATGRAGMPSPRLITTTRRGDGAGFSSTLTATAAPSPVKNDERRFASRPISPRTS